MGCSFKYCTDNFTASRWYSLWTQNWKYQVKCLSHLTRRKLLNCNGVIQHHKKLSISRSVNLFWHADANLTVLHWKHCFPLLEFIRIGFHLDNTIITQLLFWFINERGELSNAPLTHPIEEQAMHWVQGCPCLHLNSIKMDHSISKWNQAVYWDTNCPKTLTLAETHTSLAGTHTRMEDLFERVMLSTLNMQCK